MQIGAAVNSYSVVEVCAGAGGQSLGLHKAGFAHQIAVEIDATAAETLRENGGWDVVVGDVADPGVWDPADHRGVDLFAGGVPCPPFSVAGKQLGSSDERDLFAWAIEQVAVIQPRAVMLENVRGLSSSRFAAYRQRVLDRLAELGYVGGWRLLYAADFGVPQLRPRFVLVALKAEDAKYFRWPDETHTRRVTVGEALRDLMASRGWEHADEWATLASDIGPTLVGGSKKHGGADLGPTRAKAGWAKLFVDARGVADHAPEPGAPSPHVKMPRLTVEMAARIQGWKVEDGWRFAGRKTSQYRQVGNAFPPPVAEAVGRSIVNAFERVAEADAPALGADLHDPIYRKLAESDGFVTYDELLEVFRRDDREALERRIAAIHRDFHIDIAATGDAVRLGEFKGFTGQDDHRRHAFFATQRNRVS